MHSRIAKAEHIDTLYNGIAIMSFLTIWTAVQDKLEPHWRAFFIWNIPILLQGEGRSQKQLFVAVRKLKLDFTKPFASDVTPKTPVSSEWKYVRKYIAENTFHSTT